MSLDYSYLEAFVTRVNDPDVFDAVGAPVAGVDQFFVELGKIARKIQDKTLTAADAQSAKAVLQNFSDGINRLNARIAQSGAVVGNAQDAQFKAFFGKMAANTNLAIQQVTYAADEIAAGNSASIQKFGAAASSILKNVGGFIGLLQIGNEFKENGLTAVGVDKAGEKALGVITGLAGGELAALLAGGLAVALGGPALVVAGVAIAAAVGVGYVASKAGEALWEPFRYVYEQQFLPSVFNAGTTAYNTIATGLSDLSIQMGKFDGTWLEGLEGVSDSEKSGFTSLMSGIAKIPATAALNADIKKLFVADFTEDALVGRDLLLKTILTFAKDNGYASERITANAANVTLDLPNFPSTALTSLRDYVQTQLSSADQVGWALTGPGRVVIGTGAGTHAASEKDSLLIGTAGVDGLIGGAGNDDLIGGAGADTLLGGAGTDDLFGGDDDDVLNGGEGGDYLRGGAGNDTYIFSGAFGSDSIADSDGSGTIQVDGVTLLGGKKIADNTWYNKEQGIVYALMGTGSHQSLLIKKDSSLNTIRVQGWQNGQLGLTMDDTLVETPEVARTYTGDQHGQIITDPETGAQYYEWADTSWTSEGVLTGGVVEAGYKDVINGSSGNDKIDGKGGNDLLYGGDGNDEIEGGDGDDLIGGGKGSDTIKGGAGNDAILSATNVVAPQRAGPTDTWDPTLAANGGSTTMDDAPDVIDAGDGNDLVYAGRGGDRIEGGAGNDKLWGLEGDDIIEGGADDDELYGDGIDLPGAYGNTPAANHGSDFLDGGEGSDKIWGYGKDDSLFGGAGNDLLWGDASGAALAGEYHGSDYLDGEDGDDTLTGNGGGDTLYGGDGNDTLFGDAEESDLAAQYHGDDYIDGEDGDDALFGDGGNDTLYGGEGNDELHGDAWGAALADQYHGDDYLDGEAGDDLLFGNGRNDMLYGGDGNDELQGDSNESVLAGQYHGDDYLDGENGEDALFGGGGNDTLYGGEGKDLLHGDAYQSFLAGQYHGNDYLDGQAGDDLLIGDGGNDTLYGGDGDDEMQGDAAEVSLAGQYHGDDYLDGEAGNDKLFGLGGDDTLYGGDGNDIMLGDSVEADLSGEYHGNDYLDGQAGDDLLVGNGGNDTLLGGDGDDVLWGDSSGGTPGFDGDDMLDGGAGADTLHGGGGNDVLEGGEGNDVLYGDDGNDTMLVGMGDTAQGGLGDDTYKVSGNAELIDQSGQNHYTIDAAQATVVKLWDFSQGGGTLEVINADSAGNAPELTFLPSGNQVLSIGGLQVLGTGWADGSLASVSINGQTYTATDLLRNSPTGRSVDVVGTNQNVVTGLGVDDITVHEGGNMISAGRGNDQIGLEFGGNTLEFQSGDGQDIVRLATGVLAAASAVTITLGAQADLASLRIGLVQRGSKSVVLYLDSTRTDSITLEPAYGVDDVELFLANIVITAGGQTTTLAGLLAAGQEIQGDAGDNHLMAFNKPSVLSGAAGNDVLIGSAFNDTLDGGSGDDTLVGGAGDDTYVWGRGAGDDTVNEESGFNTLQLSNLVATDVMVRDDGGGLFIKVIDTGEKLRISGGSFDSTIFADGVRWDLAALQLKALEGSVGSDVIWGFSTDDTLDGGDGNDSLRGGAGNDRMIGGAGNDSLGGDSGSDTFVWGRGDGNDSIYDWGGIDDAVEFRDLNASDLTMFRYNGGDAVFRINDTGEELAITQNFYSTDEGFYTVEWLRFADGTSWSIQDQSLNIELKERSNYFEQTLVGWSLADHIVGGASDNYLYGVGGDDILDGGAGNDQLYGGVGNDTYVWSSGAGNDYISDYEGQYGEYVAADNYNYHGGGGFDSVKLTGVDPADIALSHDPEYLDLTIQIVSTGETLTVSQGLDSASPNYFLEQIVFDNGVVWNAGDISARAVSTGVNHAPEVVFPIEEQEAEAQGQFHLEIPSDVFYDQDDDALTYSASLANGDVLPSWLSFDAVTRTFSGTPGNADVGNLSLRVTATDVAGATADSTFSIDVTNVNDAPVVASAIVNQAVTENVAWSYTVPVDAFADADADAGDSLSYGATLGNGDALPSWLSFDAGTRTFSGTPDNADVSSLSLKVIATDMAGATADSTFNIDVVNVNDAPVVTTAIDGQASTEDTAWSFTVPAGTFADVDAGDSLSYSATLGNGDPMPAWLNFDVITRTFSGTPDNVDVGSLSLMVTATDVTGASVSSIFSVAVANANDAPTVSVPLLDQVADRNALWTYVVSANVFDDMDVGDGLTFSANLADGSALPLWLSFDMETRTFAGIPSGAVADQLAIEVTATDSAGATATTGFNLDLSNGNASVINGTADAETLIGTAESDYLYGFAGVDELVGQDGDDTLDGGDDNDYLFGQIGNDVYLFGRGAGQDYIEDYEVAGNTDTMRFDATVSVTDIKVTRDESNLYLSIEGTEDRVTVGNWFAEDAYKIEQVEFSDGTMWNAAVLEGMIAIAPATEEADVIYGSEDNDTLVALGGDDEIYGNGGDDSLNGDGGSDFLEGGDGNDILDGGTEDDYLSGGAGDDTYIYNFGGGIDVISDVDNLGHITYRDDQGAEYTLSGGVRSAPDQTYHDASGRFTYDFNPNDLSLSISLDGQLSMVTQNYDLVENSLGIELTDAHAPEIVVGSLAPIELISTTGNGLQSNGASFNAPAISADGRYVAFMSNADNLIAGDTNGTADIFIKDILTGAVVRAGTAIDGLAPNSWSYRASFSADSRYIAFSSDASNLVSGDENSSFDVFVEDLRTGVTTRASTTADGAEANGGSYETSLSADGRYLTFQSTASNLVSGDMNGWQDIFVKDLQTGAVTRVNTAVDGTEANNESEGASFSSDGRYVAFQSTADNLVAGDTNNQGDIFVKDLQTGAITRVSTAAGGAQAHAGSTGASISADGRYVAFTSNAGNLVSGDTNNQGDIFVKDLQTGVTTRVSTAADGTEANGSSFVDGRQFMSADGRYVVFQSDASNLVGGDTNNSADVFIKDLVTGQIARLNVAADGMQGDPAGYHYAFSPTISSDGRHVVFTSYASSLTPGDANNAADVFAVYNPLMPMSTVVTNGGPVMLEGVSIRDRDAGGTSLAVAMDVANGGLELLDTTGLIFTDADGSDGTLAFTGTLSDLNIALNLGIRYTADAGFVGNDVLSLSVNDQSIDGGLTDAAVLNISVLSSSEINGTTGDDLLMGTDASDAIQLTSGLGNDIVQAGNGNDILSGGDGNNLLDGGNGADVLSGNADSELFIGGAGNDAITTSAGNDIIAFNRGDGLDTVAASSGKDNTLSLGHGIVYADLLFKTHGSDLIMVTGTDEQVTFSDWYADVNNHSVANLQLVIEGTSDYDPASTNILNNKRVMQFDFDGLVNQFDQACAATPELTSWALSSSLLDFHLSSSDTAAIGGDLAYQYAQNGNLSSMSLEPAQTLLGYSQFGVAGQSLQAQDALQDLTPRLV